MNEKTKNIISIISRWFVGLVFLFSSFVKGVDPLGTTYKIEDYLVSWHIGSMDFLWALPMADFLSMALITLEFAVGVALIFNAFKRITPWVLALMMAFFTCTTLIDALTNLVDDCGCFGDAVKLTNWQTFWKNVVLDVPTVWLLLNIDKASKRRTERDVLVVIFAAAMMVTFGIYNIKNEPCIDFRPWKVGNVMIDQPADGEAPEMKSFLVYRNKQTGEEREFENKDFMEFYNATPDFNEAWEFVDSRVEDPFQIKADGFSMLDADGEDHATELINSEDYLLIATVHDLKAIGEEGAKSIKQMYRFALENDMQMVVLTAALTEEVQAFLYENEMDDLEYYFADATAIKAMMRSNPGYVLMKNATVMGKWARGKGYKINDIDLKGE